MNLIHEIHFEFIQKLLSCKFMMEKIAEFTDVLSFIFKSSAILLKSKKIAKL